jgi:cytoplasmic FMR1 interacting protein
MVFLERVTALDELPIKDNVPRLQSAPLSVEYEMAPSSNVLQCLDHSCYPADFSSELQAIAQLDALHEKGRALVRTLYSYRGVSRAIPVPPRGSSKEQMDALSLKTFEVLRPEIAKIKALMDYQDLAVSTLKECTYKLLKQDKKKVVPEGLYDALVSTVDVLQQLDKLKDSKSCLANDLSRYKRCLVTAGETLSRDEVAVLEAEAGALSHFLGNLRPSDKLTFPSRFLCSCLRDALRSVPGHDELMCRLLQRCVDRLEGELYLTPAEKHSLLRAVPLLLWLADCEDSAFAASSSSNSDGSSGAFNAFKQKRVKLAHVQRLLQRYPVVPECGDAPATLVLTLQGAPHFTADTAPLYSTSAGAAEQAYSLPAQRAAVHEQHDEFCTELACTLAAEAAAAAVPSARSSNSSSNSAAEEQQRSRDKELSLLVLSGLRLLQRWSSALLESYAWKLATPCLLGAEQQQQHGSDGTQGPTGGLYARALRYNHSKEELSALAEVSLALRYYQCHKC